MMRAAQDDAGAPQDDAGAATYCGRRRMRGAPQHIAGAQDAGGGAGHDIPSIGLAKAGCQCPEPFDGFDG